ncbi:hypothetical protein AAFF_G00098800 [Aldrovandia affinis]|uniref:Uncharacterized protein n=1 Tax=Aldrovandia affinis TaxID=143900 RepID=A0AAD7WBY3_9TELE|nr:hypothetical protein AAFF_G00098800 [Aldrovandia affinis]
MENYAPVSFRQVDGGEMAFTLRLAIKGADVAVTEQSGVLIRVAVTGRGVTQGVKARNSDPPLLDRTPAVRPLPARASLKRIPPRSHGLVNTGKQSESGLTTSDGCLFMSLHTLQKARRRISDPGRSLPFARSCGDPAGSSAVRETVFKSLRSDPPSTSPPRTTLPSTRLAPPIAAVPAASSVSRAPMTSPASLLSHRLQLGQLGLASGLGEAHTPPCPPEPRTHGT